MKESTRKYLFYGLCLLSYLFVCIAILFYVFYIEDLYSENGSHNEQVLSSTSKVKSKAKYFIEIWGKASLSLYLWQHIMKADLQEMYNGMMKIGNLTIDNLSFSFKYGPGYIQTTVPSDVQYLILILNGRTKEKVQFSKEWLEYLPKFSKLKKVAVILLGNEKCENDWILPYMKSRDGKIDVVFLVYDSPLVDDLEFYQWPLGVAQYRGFPNIEEASVNYWAKRPYKYNFLGTVYQNSSRETLVNQIRLEHLTRDVFLRERQEWLSKETRESLSSYIEALKSSDLTFSPVGMNTECYRIYEAMSLGSVPIIEDVVTPGVCDTKPPAPLRLLKKYNAPVIWVKNWNQLDLIVKKENQLTHRQIVNRRIKAVKWYSRFKRSMKELFVQVIQDKFFNFSVR